MANLIHPLEIRKLVLAAAEALLQNIPMSLASPPRTNRIGTLGAPVMAGRFLAWCAHPLAAWHVGSWTRRALIVSGYFAASYLLTIVALALVPRL